ncbi:hypothetical protein QVD17_40203 [Tagetes erecta]|uniref:Uncharacterized protein n=1 Tax=Tagetes erecta TaxID=13708 RepID=A0AAD8JRQ3_TARER|nr:hypothetical protein QVD17_40203 [Tagetes erecta]
MGYLSAGAQTLPLKTVWCPNHLINFQQPFFPPSISDRSCCRRLPPAAVVLLLVVVDLIPSSSSYRFVFLDLSSVARIQELVINYPHPTCMGGQCTNEPLHHAASIPSHLRTLFKRRSESESPNQNQNQIHNLIITLSIAADLLLPGFACGSFW